MNHQLNLSVVTPGGTVAQAILASADAEVALVDQAVTNASNVLVNVAFPYATIKSVILLSSVAVTIETNSASEADDSISLEAGIPKVFCGAFGENPFTDDVTAIYLTAVAAGTLNMRVLYDPTP